MPPSKKQITPPPSPPLVPAASTPKPYLAPGEIGYVISGDYAMFRGAAIVLDFEGEDIFFEAPLPAFTSPSDMILDYEDYSKWANTHACEDTTIRDRAPKSMLGFRKIGR